MKVYGYVAIDVVEALPIWVVYIDGELPCCTPVCDVAPCECVGGTLQFEGYALYPSTVGRRCKVEFTERGVERQILLRDSYQLCRSFGCALKIIPFDVLSVVSGVSMSGTMRPACTPSSHLTARSYLSRLTSEPIF